MDAPLIILMWVVLVYLILVFRTNRNLSTKYKSEKKQSEPESNQLGPLGL
jgi:hypothetical protein